MIRGLLRGGAALLALAAFIVVATGAHILFIAAQSDTGPAEAAIILGAAVLDDEPTPVFRERLRHGVTLYQSGRVPLLVTTGGSGPNDELSEGEAGRAWAIANGVPDRAILLETQSRTTGQNLAFSVPLLQQHGLGRVLIVTDPLHMARALRMARDRGIDAHPSPTSTSRYRTLRTQVPMLLREIWFTLLYFATGA